MSEIRIQKGALILGGALVLALVAIAILVTYLLAGRNTGEPMAVPGQGIATPSPVASASSDSRWPTLVSRSTGDRTLPALQAAAVDCQSFDIVASGFFAATTEVGPGGSSLVVDGDDEVSLADLVAAGTLSPSEQLDVHQCVLEMLEAPPGVLERMGRTRALDGTQTETWPGYKVTWTYHPDAGLDAVFSYTSE